jgi:hypothetical protein
MIGGVDDVGVPGDAQLLHLLQSAVEVPFPAGMHQVPAFKVPVKVQLHRPLDYGQVKTGPIISQDFRYPLQGIPEIGPVRFLSDELHDPVRRAEDSDNGDLSPERGFNVHKEGNGDIAVKIEYKERVLEVLSILRHDCIDYDSIDIRRSNLEEIFLNLTGSKLAEGEA